MCQRLVSECWNSSQNGPEAGGWNSLVQLLARQEPRYAVWRMQGLRNRTGEHKTLIGALHGGEDSVYQDYVMTYHTYQIIIHHHHEIVSRKIAKL